MQIRRNWTLETIVSYSKRFLFLKLLREIYACVRIKSKINDNRPPLHHTSLKVIEVLIRKAIAIF